MEGKRCAEYDPTYTPPTNHVPNEKDEVLLSFFHEATLPSKVFGYNISLKIKEKRKTNEVRTLMLLVIFLVV